MFWFKRKKVRQVTINGFSFVFVNQFVLNNTEYSTNFSEGDTAANEWYLITAKPRAQSKSRTIEEIKGYLGSNENDVELITYFLEALEVWPNA